jgi:hypothetical protein
MNSLFDSGNLSQEMGGENNNEEYLHEQLAMISGGNIYVDCNAQLQSICNLIEKDNDLTNYFTSKFNSLIGEVHSMVLEKTDNGADEGSEFVSCNPAVDKNRTYVRKRSATEPRKRKKSRNLSDVEITSKYGDGTSFFMEK